MGSGSCPTTPASKRTTEEPITVLGETARLQKLLWNLGWRHVPPTSWERRFRLADGASVVMTLALSCEIGRSIFIATPSSPGDQPTPNTPESGGTGCPAPTPAKSKSKADATAK